jgi:hypothetical protein
MSNDSHADQGVPTVTEQEYRAEIAGLSAERDEAQHMAQKLAQALREVAGSTDGRQAIAIAQDLLGEIATHPWLWETSSG